MLIYNIAFSVLLAVVLQKVGVWLYTWAHQLMTSRQLPGLPGTKLLQGDLYSKTFDEYMDRTINFVQTTRARVHTVWVYFLYPIYSLNHPDTAKLLLKSSAPKGSGSGYILLKPWIGNGLLAHPGGKVWERNRHLLTPAFHFGILKHYVDIFNDVADDLLIQLSREDHKHSVEISTPVTIATLDSLLRCALSYQGNIQDTGQDHPYVDAVHRLARLYIQRVSNPLVYSDFVYSRTNAGQDFKSLCDYVHKFANDIIASRKEALAHKEEIRLEKNEAEDDKRRLDFLDVLLTARDDEGKGLTDLEIRSEVDTFLFAGHDTTSSAISWAIYALAKYEDMQEKVYEEVTRVVGDRSIEWYDLSCLTFLAIFIKEVLRMYSIVPMVARVIDEPLMIDGVTLPAGSIININIHAINHRPDVWPDHEKFRPERFEESMGNDRDPFSFIPFSAGSRNCIGQNFAMNEIKVILSRIVQAFCIQLDRHHQVIPSPSLVMRSKNGIKVFLHPR